MKDLKKIPTVTLILLLLSFSNISAQYIWPIDGKKLLNSSFAECRHNHFHAGIDLHAKEGTPLKAIEDGYIWHISVNPFGYGKSLFLKLKDGKIVVYAHLQGFDERVEKIVELEQKRRFSYRVSLYFNKERLPVKNGDLVGYAGSTGAMGAHLHFEMRDSQNRPIDPLSQGYTVSDSTPPLIKAIQLTPLDDSSSVSGMPFPLIVKPYGSENYYSFIDTITIDGRVGLEVLCEDYQNSWPFRLNIWKVEMYVNGKLRFKSIYDRFSYAHTREVELEFNYDLYNKGLGRFHRLYVYGDNHLSFYKKRDGILNIEALKNINEIKIVCYDANKNRAALILYLKKANGYNGEIREEALVSNSTYIRKRGIFYYRNIVGLAMEGKEKAKIIKMKNLIPIKRNFKIYGKYYFFLMLPKSEAACTLLVEHSKGNDSFVFTYSTVLKNEHGVVTSADRGLNVIIKKGQLYEDLYARVSRIKEKIPKGMELKKGVFIVEPIGTIFKNKVDIVIPYVSTSKKVGIYKKQKDGWLFLDGNYDESKKSYVASSKHLGTFALLEDNVPPDICDFQIVKDGTQVKKIFFTVKDMGSGVRISDILITLDGVSYIPVFQPYRDEISYLLFGEKIDEGGHTAKIRIKDRAGNKSSLSVSF